MSRIRYRGGWVQPGRADILPYFQRLVPEYRTYCTTVSKRSMALSIETCAYLWWLCDTKVATTVADLGSGFSSYVLRRYATESGRSVVVHSVDSDPEWLERSRQFSVEHGQDGDGFMLGDDWLTLGVEYDVVLNDYDRGDVREAYAGHGADRLKPGGVIVFDDAQNASHLGNMADTCKSRDMDLFALVEQTMDEVGRFAMVGVRP